MMTLVLSSTAVDPDTLAPKGTVLNAETATDSRAGIRVPFTQIVDTALKVSVCVGLWWWAGGKACESRAVGASIAGHEYLAKSPSIALG
jgi:hypothetical protein